MKANIRQLMEGRFKEMLEENGLPKQDAGWTTIPPEVLNMGELADLLDLIPDETLREAGQAEIDADTAQTNRDARYAGVPR